MNINISEIIIGFIRTIIPTIVGAFVAWLAMKGIIIDPSAAMGLSSFLFVLSTGIYYLAVRLISKKYPWVEWLLGSKKTPSYSEFK